MLTNDRNINRGARLETVKPKKTISWYAFISFLVGIGTYAWFFTMVKLDTFLAMLLSALFALIAIITGHKSRFDIHKSLDDMKGKTLANIGLVLGYFVVLLGIFISALIFTGSLPAVLKFFGT